MTREQELPPVGWQGPAPLEEDVPPQVAVDAFVPVSTHEQAETPQIWLLPDAPTAPGLSSAANRVLFEVADGLGGERCVPGFTVHPGDGGPKDLLEDGLEPEQVLEEAVRAGAKVAAVAHRDRDGVLGLLDIRLKQFWTLAEALRLPSIVNAGARASEEDLERVATLAQRYPRLPIVLAHAGMPLESAALDLTRDYPNLYLLSAPLDGELPSLPPPYKATRVALSDEVLDADHPPAPPQNNDTTPTYHLLVLATQGRVLFGTGGATPAATGEMAEKTRRWIRNGVSHVLGASRVEDVGREMEKAAAAAEDMVFGHAARDLVEEVRDIDAALKTLGWERPGEEEETVSLIT